VSYQYGILDEYPKFKFDLEHKGDAKQASEIMVRLWNVGVELSKDEVREKCGFRKPGPDEEIVQNPSYLPPEDAEIIDGDVMDPNERILPEPQKPKQLPDGIGAFQYFAEGKKKYRLNHKKVQRKMEAIENRYKKLIAAEMTKSVDKMAATFKNRFKSLKSNSKEINGLRLSNMATIRMLFRKMTRETFKFSNEVTKEQASRANAYAKSIGMFGEAGYQFDYPDDFMDAVGDQWAYSYGSAASAEMTSTFMAGIMAGQSAEQIADRFKDIMTKYGYAEDAGKWYQMERMARNAMSQTFNKSRLGYGQRSDNVIGYHYIAELDGRTTPRCRAFHDRRWPKSDPNVLSYYPPNHEYCRSMMDFIYAWESPDNWDSFPKAHEPTGKWGS